MLRIHMAAACIGRSFANFAEGSARRRASHFGGVHPVSTRNMLRTLRLPRVGRQVGKGNAGTFGIQSFDSGLPQEHAAAAHWVPRPVGTLQLLSGNGFDGFDLRHWSS